LFAGHFPRRKFRCLRYDGSLAWHNLIPVGPGGRNCPLTLILRKGPAKTHGKRPGRGGQIATVLGVDCREGKQQSLSGEMSSKAEVAGVKRFGGLVGWEGLG